MLAGTTITQTRGTRYVPRPQRLVETVVEPEFQPSSELARPVLPALQLAITVPLSVAALIASVQLVGLLVASLHASLASSAPLEIVRGCIGM